MMKQKEEERKIRVFFLGTPEFAVPSLQTLLNTSVFEVVGVATQPDRPAGRSMELQKSNVKILAEEFSAAKGRLGRKFPILTPENINAEEVLREIKRLDADVAVVVAYGQILKPDFLSLFPAGAVNVHASLLPRWRGAAPIAWSLLSRDNVTGVTLQKVEQKLDSGPIIGKAEVMIADDWDAVELYRQLSKKGAELLRRHLPEYVAGKAKLTRQDETLVTWAPKISKEQGKIDWNKTAPEICAQIKALIPWPGTYTTRNGKSLKILRGEAIQHNGGQPGELVGEDKITFWVQCGGGTVLKVGVVQPESRSRLSAGEYMKGYPFSKGDKLGT